ncbi:MAG: response regulator [Burkholderiaceae bacterium]
MPLIRVVDADPALVALLTEWLREAGFEVDHAGRIAPRPAVRYDLILVDLPFPRLDGMQRITDIAARHPGVPIIAVSTAFFPAVCGYFEVARALGVRHALSKPLFRGELLAAVRLVLKP